MSDRETKKVLTPVGNHEIVMNTYVTGRENRAIVQSMVKGMSLDGKGEVKNMDAAVIKDSEDVAFATVIVSVDGHKDGDEVDGKRFSIVEEILDMHVKDYNFVVKETNKISFDRDFEEKKR